MIRESAAVVDAIATVAIAMAAATAESLVKMRSRTQARALRWSTPAPNPP
jgi:hypothetical protein